jgi:dihydrofolate reductase
MTRQVILYIAMSLDGYIAKDDYNIDFLSLVQSSEEDYGYSAFLLEIDTVILGRKTYDKVLSFGIEFPYREKQCIVLSRTKVGRDNNVEFFNGDVKDLITKLQMQDGKDIYCDGGGEVVYHLLKSELIDKMIISIIPHLVGNGVRLFKDSRPEQYLRLTRSSTFHSGLVQLWYEKMTK